MRNKTLLKLGRQWFGLTTLLSFTVTIAMMKSYTYLCLLYAVTIVEVRSRTITGRVGQTLTFECSNWDVWTSIKSNSKYFCNSPCTEKKHIIVTAETGKMKRNKRIQIQNNGAKGLSVTFTNLQKSDAKTYYCGLDRAGFDSFVKVNLEVLDAALSVPKTTSETAPITSTSCTSTSVSSGGISRATDTVVTARHNTTVAFITEGTGTVPYLIVGTVVLITILVILLMITKKMKKQMTSVSSGDIPEPDPEQTAEYDEIRDHHGESQPEVISPVYALVTHSDGNPDGIYANAYHHQVMQEDFQNENYSNARKFINEVSLVGPHAVTVPLTDLEYSLLQLPR
ncbi:CMRF35-like molecule 8 [Sphaeramia orbicularis]|uniref:CMRF35-like molecule 8 n=1 Tax=Sphaeramia orbicularis TaxID=375764 RepID=UPI00117FE403|nr:CMRF35-like molecule 8 [Sphaeramia orbicularis]XP_029996481.1 CMRF35-like molecule 8 [Sphaeramia orbicularis]